MSQITGNINHWLGLPQRLPSEGKEHLVISGIGSEGVCGLAADPNGDNNRDNNNRTSAGGTAMAG